MGQDHKLGDEQRDDSVMEADDTPIFIRLGVRVELII